MSLTDIACSKWSCKSRPQHSTFRSQPRRSLRGANSGLEGSRMTSWTDALWNWSHSCDLLRHLWSAFLFEWNDISVTLRWTPCNLSNCHTFLWKTQENAQMVNRILSVGPTFNRKVEARFPVPLLSKPTAENCWMSFLIACETLKGWQTHTHNLNEMNLSVLSFPQGFNADRSAFFFTSSLLEDSDQSWGSRFQSSQEAWRNVFMARNTRKDSAGASWVTLLAWVDRILFEFWEISPFKIIEQAVWRNSIRDVVTARIVSLGAMPCASSLPGLRKTCSALLTEGLCHTSEERSFFFWTGKGTLVAFQSRFKRLQKARSQKQAICSTWSRCSFHPALLFVPRCWVIPTKSFAWGPYQLCVFPDHLAHGPLRVWRCHSQMKVRCLWSIFPLFTLHSTFPGLAFPGLRFNNINHPH